MECFDVAPTSLKSGEGLYIPRKQVGIRGKLVSALLIVEPEILGQWERWLKLACVHG